MRRTTIIAGLALLGLGGAPAARAAECPGQDRVDVPGAERQVRACLDDLTTAGTTRTGHTDQTDWSTLHARGTRNPSGVPGLQVDGYFPDTSRTNSYKGWFHDAQFVLRLPERWNGKLVVTGAPGVRRQYANDFIISDWVLSKGYAFASTDKGNSGVNFYTDGAQPGDAIAEWHERVTELTVAAKAVVQQLYGRPPARTYMTGISNGGYLTRMALETHPELYDGGVDWEGTLMLADSPNLFTYLPAALKHYPAYKRGDEAAHRAILAAGFEPGSEFQWDDHYTEYWDLTQRVYREELDPEYDGPLLAGIPFCQSGTPRCDADYDFAARRSVVGPALAKTALTGRIGKPMLTLHGTYDALLPIRTDSDVYTRMIGAQGREAMHRYYVFEAGAHVDSRHDRYPGRVRPLLPCYRTIFEAFERWIEQGAEPPPSQFAAKPDGGDIVNECSLVPARSAGGDGGRPAATPPGPLQGGPPGSAADRRPAPRALRVRVSPRRDRRPPYHFRVSGQVLLPEGLTRRQACTGRVSVQVKASSRTISTRRTALRRDCSFALRVTFRQRWRLGSGRLRVVVRFLGNDDLRPMRARRRAARAG